MNKIGCYLATKSGKVCLVGKDIQSASSKVEYSDIFNLFSKCENDLNEEIPFDIHVNYIVLDALVKVFKNFENSDAATKFFNENIKARNFFYLINDLTIQVSYHSSEIIYDKFFNTNTLKKIDKFYDEFSDIYDFSRVFGYSTIYLFDYVFNSKGSKEKYLDNIFKSIYQNKNDNIRHLSCNIINELYNEIRKPERSDKTKNEYYHKVEVINSNWNKIIQDNLPTLLNNKGTMLYCIDTLYYLIIE